MYRKQYHVEIDDYKKPKDTMYHEKDKFCDGVTGCLTTLGIILIFIIFCIILLLVVVGFIVLLIMLLHYSTFLFILLIGSVLLFFMIGCPLYGWYRTNERNEYRMSFFNYIKEINTKKNNEAKYR